MSDMHLPRIRQILAAGAVAGLIATTAACGSSDDSSTSTAAAGTTAGAAATTADSGAAGVAKAKAAIEPFIAQSEPLTIDTPLSKKPPSGKTVYWLQASLDDTSIITPGMEAATKALGWNLKTLIYDPSKPQEVNSTVMQAVAANPDYIAIAGSPPEQWQEGLDAAKAKGIPIFDSYDQVDPLGKENGIYSQVSRNDYVRYAKLMADYVAADSNGDANILLVNVPAYPVLAPYKDDMQKELDEVCPNCKLDELEISQQDLLAGNVPNSVVSYLRTHPNTKYAVFSLGALTTGVNQALASGGVSDVKLLGSNPVEANLKALENGSEYAWVALPKALSGWYLVDAMARHSVGDSTKPSDALLPTQIITKDTVPEPLTRIGFDGPAGYPDEFAKLWKLQ